MENYFNYFTEIEEHFQRKWGGIVRLSPLDWALIETWKDAGLPLEAVLRGIDTTYEHHERRASKTRKVNGLGFCSQEVLAAAEEMKEAAVGSAREAPKVDTGFERNEIAAFLRRNADAIGIAKLPDRSGISAEAVAKETVTTLMNLVAELETKSPGVRLEDLERRLTVLEERLMAVLLAATPEDAVVKVREQADRELASYRRKMPAAQIDQLMKQYIHKRLLEKYGLPRLSLFYMK
jgi:hypothetical protein